MKRKLLGLAILGTFASAAQAQSSVTIYGVMDMGLEYGRYNDGVTLKKLDSGDQMASRIGFRGTEDIGGGLKANFMMESGLSLDTGATTQPQLFGRGASVGLQGSFGRFDMGRMFAPIFFVHIASDPSTIGYTTASAVSNLAQVSELGRTYTGGFLDNNIRYRTPTINGIDSEWAYSFGNELPGGQKDYGKNLGMNVQYNNSPLWAGFGYNKFTARRVGDKADSSQTTYSIGAKYNFGVATVGTAYLRTKNMMGALEVLGAAIGGAPVNGGDASSWHITGMIPAGPGEINLGVARLTETGDKATNGYHLGYSYTLSKRTNLYGFYTGLSNNNKGVRGLGTLEGAYTKVNAGFNPSAISLGIRHLF